MKLVKPFFSLHASGSFARVMTVRACGDNVFILAKHTPEHIHRSAGQAVGAEWIKWNAERIKEYNTNYIDSSRPLPYFTEGE